MQRNTKSQARRVAFSGMLFALAIVLSVVEGIVTPALGLPPGIKPGLANIVVMYALFTMGAGQAAVLVLMKSFFVFLTRGVAAAALSASGGFCSLAVMLLLLLLTRRQASYLILSVMGAITHNLGQLAMAALWLSTAVSFAYTPVLILAGIGMGTMTSLTLKALMPTLQKLNLTN
ncbi:Gx transporter family protein [Pygmaiobacter massiliensis]|uniref:Gx transporter family protein n=1 Tax=Pygmaiobacter massiliensis TaxID=1917873 RepID=UPI002A7F4A00|nr:Gx transporter family protein [Pygmaiobacter massiliensis]MDY4785620.1 Gx transporter family protein [Pygmaiobacter massiliensis]